MELSRPKNKNIFHFIVFKWYFQIIITSLNKPQSNYKYLGFAFYIIDINKDMTVFEKSLKFINGKLK